MAMAGLLRNMSANLVGRSPGTVEYEITLVPPGKSTTTPAAGPARTGFERRAELPGPVANQESESRGVVIEIQPRIAGLLRVQGSSGSAGQVEASPGTGASSV
jgi:hypothetical protein